MGRLFCLLGKSGSGKSTVYRELLAGGGLAPVVPYTTRPRREGEAEGGEYHFISYERLLAFQQDGRVIESRRYATMHGEWWYATVEDGTFDLARENCLTIATLEALAGLRQHFGRQNVVPLYLFLEDGLRLQRQLARERQTTRPDYREMCRRYLADEEDFSDARLAEVGIVEKFCTKDLQECTAEIRGAIRRYRRVQERSYREDRL